MLRSKACEQPEGFAQFFALDGGGTFVHRSHLQ